MRLNDKVAIITGGAGKLGRGIVRRFVQEGASVVIADIDAAGGEAIAKEMKDSGGEARFLHLDITDEAAWASAVGKTVEAYGKLDILINDAAAFDFRAEYFDLAAWDKVLAVNARGGFLAMKAAVPEMVKGGGGSVITVLSVSGEVGQKDMHMAYGASKAALHQMTRAIAVQFAKDNVRANAVVPGAIATTPEVMERLSGRIQATTPMGRPASIDDVVNAILFLASDEATFITGVALPVEGGYLAYK